MSTFGTVGKSFVELSKSAVVQVFADWKEMVDLDIRIVGAEATILRGSSEVEPEPRSLIIETMVEGAGSGPMFFLFPCSLAAPAIGKMLMLPSDVVEEKSSGDLGKMDFEAFKELANLLCGSSNRAMRKERRQLRVSQNVAHLAVRQTEEGNENPCGLPNNPLAVVDFKVSYNGTTAHVLQIVTTELSDAISRVDDV